MYLSLLHLLLYQFLHNKTKKTIFSECIFGYKKKDPKNRTFKIKNTKNLKLEKDANRRRGSKQKKCSNAYARKTTTKTTTALHAQHKKKLQQNKILNPKNKEQKLRNIFTKMLSEGILKRKTEKCIQKIAFVVVKNNKTQ